MHIEKISARLGRVNRLLKALLVWLLLLVLPLQGHASASMRLCATGTPAAHAHADGSPDQAAASDCGDDHAASPHHHAKCGTCAACCTGASITGALPAPLVPAIAASSPIPFEGAIIASVDLALPERPPRA